MVINHYNYWPYTPLHLGDIRTYVENHIMASFEVPSEILRGNDIADAAVRAFELYRTIQGKKC